MIKKILYGVVAAGVIGCASADKNSNSIVEVDGYKIFLDAYVKGNGYGAVPDYSHSRDLKEINDAIRKGDKYLDQHFGPISPGVSFSANDDSALARAFRIRGDQPIDWRTLESVIFEMAKEAQKGDKTVGVLENRFFFFK